jgi:DNA-3-methyladenine glycosylase
VEVEAYTDDPASHGYRRTERSAIMHDTYGHIYVYFIYGMYHCLNFTTDKDQVGAILVRAVEPLSGLQLMKKRRGIDSETKLCNGPGKLCQAFDININVNHSRVGEYLRLYHGRAEEILSSPRIGITKATDLHWRFFEKDSPFVSR